MVGLGLTVLYSAMGLGLTVPESRSVMVGRTSRMVLSSPTHAEEDAEEDAEKKERKK